MVRLSFFDRTNSAWKQTITAAIACSSQIWIAGGYISMFNMHEVSNDLYGWLVSCCPLIELITITPAVWMSTLLGQKAVLQIAAVPGIAAYILLSQESHIVDLFMARALQGVSSGLVAGVLPLYLTDISTEGTRAGLNYIQISMWFAGILLIYSISPFIPPLATILILLASIMVWSALMCWIPESPWYYFDRGRESKALESLAWLRGSQDLARREYDTSATNRIQATWKELISKQVAVITALGILHWAFVPAWLAYGYKTFYTLTENEDWSNGMRLTQAVLCFFVTTISCCLLKSSSRRAIIIRSMIVAFLASLPPSAYMFYITRYHYAAYSYTTPLVIALIILYPVLSTYIFYPLTYSLSLEILYKDKQRKIFIYLAHVSAAVTAISSLLVPQMQNSNNDFVNFSILTVYILISFIFIYICLPETKGKHIFEINRLFKS